jgi:D-3-phosphoglycerate dehydrogenase
MTHAVYHASLKWQPDNVARIEDRFTLTTVPDIHTKAAGYGIEILFLPIGPIYDEAFFAQYPDTKFVVSNTTSERHLVNMPSHIKAITLKGDAFLYNITSTPEHALGLILALHRRIPAASYEVATTGIWDRRNWPAPCMLSKMHLGILGAGRIGRMLSNMAAPLFHRVSILEPTSRTGDVLDEELQDWLSTLDVLSIHLALVDETRNFMSEERLKHLHAEALVINTAQGGILDNKALIDMLEGSVLRGAALDVFPEGPEQEQLFIRACSYVQSHNNLILTPHIAGSTRDAWLSTEARVIDKLLREYE